MVNHSALRGVTLSLPKGNADDTCTSLTRNRQGQVWRTLPGTARQGRCAPDVICLANHAGECR